MRGRPWLPWAMWGLGACCYLLALFHRMSLSVAGLTAQERFGIDATGLATFLAVQLAMYTVLQIPVGSAADRIGPRKLILTSMALMTVGSAVFAAATVYPVAVAGRALVGAGDALMFISVLRLAHNWFPGHRYALVAALTGVLGGLGQLVATAPLGALLDHAGWTPTFLIGAAATVAVGLIAAVGLRDHAGHPPPGTAAPLRATLPEVWRNRGTRHAMWTHFTLMGGFISVTAVLGQPHLVGARGLTTSAAGGLIAVSVIGFVIGSTVAGRLAGARPHLRGPIVLSCAAGMTAALTALVALPAGTPAAVIGAVLVVLGVCGGPSMVAFDLARTANHPGRSGVATGTANIGGFTFAVAAQLAAGASLDALLATALPEDLAHRLAFLPVATLAAVGALLIARNRRYAGRPPTPVAATPQHQQVPVPA